MTIVRRNNRKTFDKRKPRGRRGHDQSTRKAGHHDANERSTRVVPQSREVKRLLEGIGTPPRKPFQPDPFQLEALAALEYEDVLVTAPTGSGKTWIAREEIRRLLENGRRAWYTSPLKALTNSKYQEFIDEFGAHRVGILTGDRKENPDAPLIVGTTEIYRNQLFDSLRGGSEVTADLVVLDEAHYLADEDRGHVWEEAIILTPPRIRLLLLSATIGNAYEFAAWLEEVRGVRCGVITGPPKRPVPLRAAVLLPDKRLLPLMSADERRPESKVRMPEMPPAILLATLSGYNLLPAIVFLPTRRRCDQAASEAALSRRDPNESRREARREFMRSFVEQHPEVRGHRHWDTIIRGGVASHHAGHIPGWKLVIEKLMSAGLLDAIFATATVAAGVDFPARTVVLTGADARTGSGWRPLSASELQQMTGRAGRRGRDNVGFVVAAPGLHQDPERIAQLLKTSPDPLVSQFRATYTTLLNLLDAYGSFDSVREIAERSFAYRDFAHRLSQLERTREESEQKIKRALQEAACEIPMSVVFGLERLVGVRARLQEAKPQTRAEVFHRWLNDVVKPGRVVGVGRAGRRLVMVTEKRDGSIRGIREDGSNASFAQERIGRVYSPVYRLREEDIEHGFEEIRRRGKELTLVEPRLRDAYAEETDALKIVDDAIENLLPPNIADKQRCTEVVWQLHTTAEDYERASRRIEALREEVWLPFENRAKVLAIFGYLDYEAEKVTERGRWLADLHIDRPLLVGEALESGLFNSLEPKQLAGIMAALTADEDRDYGELELDDDVVSSLARFEDIGFKVSSEEWKHGLDPAPELNFSAAGAAVRWASGTDWSDVVRETRAEEGDLFRMFSRTGEALLQIAGLHRTHPQAAQMTAAVAEMVLREPIR